MKKILFGLTALTVLLAAAAVFAGTSETYGNTSGQMSSQQQQFLQQTKDLRQQRHEIRCELQSASQTANPDQQKIADLNHELAVIRGEIKAKAQELGVTMGSGNHQNKPLNCSGVTQ